MVKNERYVTNKIASVIIVGAGPAGLGVAIALQKMGVDLIILEKDEIGASFKKWPKETQFISPSFTGNFFKMPDLNAITPDSSPAFTTLTEHPTGDDYVEYLESIAHYNKLTIETKITVQQVEKKKDYFIISTNDGEYRCAYLIWAAGEYQYPKKGELSGWEHCTHFSDVDSFEDIEGKEAVVIGGYESGFDAAVNLVNTGKKVTVFDAESYLELVNSDSSYSLSPFTRDRIEDAFEDLTYHKESKVIEVKYKDGIYTVITENGISIETHIRPIRCTGFNSSLILLKDLFLYKSDYPLLNEWDESTITNNLFLVGPQVKHGDALFCFIYKYRQRFAVVAETIARLAKIPAPLIESVVDEYKNYNFYLTDLSCCDNDCSC